MSTTFVDEVEVTAEVVDLVADRASASDMSGHLDPEVVAALRATGINRLLLPAELGGLAASPRRCVEVVERIAMADGSTAWAAAIGFGTNLFAGYVDRERRGGGVRRSGPVERGDVRPDGRGDAGGRRLAAAHGTVAVHEQLRAGRVARSGRHVPGRARAAAGVRAARCRDDPPDLGRRRAAGYRQQRHVAQRLRRRPPSHVLVRRPSMGRRAAVAAAAVRRLGADTGGGRARRRTRRARRDQRAGPGPCRADAWVPAGRSRRHGRPGRS